MTALLLGLGACGEESGPTVWQATERQDEQVQIESLAICQQLDPALWGLPAQRFEEYPATVYLGPAHARPGQPVFVLLALPAGLQGRDLLVRYTADSWQSEADLTLEPVCVADGQELWAARLGSFGEGTQLELALRYTVLGEVRWASNRGANYRLQVQEPGTLRWLGDAHLRHNGQYVPPELVAAGNALAVYVQTYPMGAAKQVTLHWASADYSQTQALAMVLDMDRAGPHGSNSQWRAAIPADQLQPGQTLHYWLQAEDFADTVLWDSQEGKNYAVTPTAFQVLWAGGLGAVRPVSGEYREGELFHSDGSTATGCWNHGVSMSSYRERALRVYVPGLTDRAYQQDSLRRTAAGLIKVEVYSNATADRSWSGTPARFALQQGNDFVYGFFPFTQFCAGGGPNLGAQLADGSYAFKLRVSTDGGHTWFWRGSADGPLGGEDLQLSFAARCSYFNDPGDCIP